MFDCSVNEASFPISKQMALLQDGCEVEVQKSCYEIRTNH